MSNSPNWQMTTIGDVCDILAGYGFPKHLQGKQEGDYPFYKVGDISQAWVSGKINLTTANNYLSDNEARNLKAKPLPPGTTVLAKIGEAIKLNRRAMLSVPSLVDNNVMGIVPKAGKAEPKYIFYFLLTVKLGEVSQATTVPSVRKSDVADIPLPLAPLEIQKEIVAEIEKQFSRLDEAVTALKRIQANLKRYKAAVLKAAVEGKLTEQWRKEHTDVEPADQFLKRILAERRAKWEGEELAKMKAKGIKPKDDSWKKKYKEPAGPDTANLPELPKGWVWASVEQLGDVFGGLTKNPKRASLPLQLPYLRVANVYANELRLDEIEHIGIEEREESKLLVLTGDLLIVEGNGSPEQIGRVAIWDGSIEPCVHQNHLIKVRLSPACLPKWTLYWLLSANGRNYIREVSSSTSGLYTLSVGRVSGLPVPLPFLTEQQQIADEIDRRLSVTEELEATIETSLKRVERLRQTILQKAFNWRGHV